MSRFKQKGGSTPEVHTARSKLDGVLQTLRDKKEDSPNNDSYIIEEEEEDDELDVTSVRSRGRPQHSHSNRKRKRPRDDYSPPDISPQRQAQFHHTYVMKLFDRSVDLAQFSESTPLYPVCRAWMKNQPLNRNLGIQERIPTPKPEVFGLPEDENDVRECFEMPAPVVEDTAVPLPEPVPDFSPSLDIHADPQDAPEPEQLLLSHLMRWRQTRSTWKDYRRRKDMVYAPSMRLLKDIFDRANVP